MIRTYSVSLDKEIVEKAKLKWRAKHSKYSNVGKKLSPLIVYLLEEWIQEKRL